MKPKVPTCPDCGTRRTPTMLRVTSRVYAAWRCEDCGSEWTSDAVTGRLISRQSTAQDLEGGKP